MKKYFWALPLLALIMSILACGTSNTGQKVATVASTPPVKSGELSENPTSLPEPTTPAKEATEPPAPANVVYTVGDVVEVGDHRITLLGVTYKGNSLNANFLIENTGTEDLNVSSIMSFSAKDTEGTKLEQEIMDCSGGGLDGKVLPGDKLKGNICWTLPTATTFKLYYEASLFGSGAVVWSLDATNLPSPVADTTGTTDLTGVTTYKVGDVVEVQTHRITLNSAKILNNILKANFTIENNGTEDLTVSSLMSFTAKADDGTKLEIEIFDCDGSSLDGTVLPSDKLKGNICWKTGGAKTANIYYEDSLFGSGAIVWSIK